MSLLFFLLIFLLFIYYYVRARVCVCVCCVRACVCELMSWFLFPGHVTVSLYISCALLRLYSVT